MLTILEEFNIPKAVIVNIILPYLQPLPFLEELEWYCKQAQARQKQESYFLYYLFTKDTSIYTEYQFELSNNPIPWSKRIYLWYPSKNFKVFKQEEQEN
jgi:hypothetical protein